MKHKIIIIGGGASGLMLASLLPKSSLLLIEHNPKLGEKIRISGGGRCNVTNEKMHSDYFLGEHTFIQPVLKRFSSASLLRWLSFFGCEPVLRKGSQYFCKERATELLDIFQKEVKRHHIALNESVESVTKEGELFEVKTSKRTLKAEHVVVASGGLSFPLLGASDIGYRIAEHFGHTIVKQDPALVGFTVQKEQFFFKELSGLSCDVRLEVGQKQFEGAMLFTHKGVSGPAILNASLYWKKGAMSIDFLPNISLNTLLQGRKNITTLLPLPKRLTKAFLVQFGLDDKVASQLSKEERKRLEMLHHYRFSPAGTFGYRKAEVTKGGVLTQEIDSKTMMSQKVKGLYFLGEVVDVTGQLGGYNFQWAFSSAYTCAQHLKRI